MGRSSPDRKRAKRQRQKIKRKLTYGMYTRNERGQLQNVAESANVTEYVNNVCSVGGTDTDLIEMDLYDTYRSLDGESSTLKYLLKCREKLITKAKESRTKINELEKEVNRVKLESKEENERIRKYYEVIAYGQSRAGKVVRSAMGTAPAAAQIIKDLEKLYSVSYASDSDC